jgi:hypothetical protein
MLVIDTCWLWTGANRGGGYGVVRFKKVDIQAHRFSWEFVNGKIPKGLFVLHKCDVRNCVKPDHLFLGTSQDNMKDCSLKGRTNFGEKCKIAKLRNNDIPKIFSMQKSGMFQRDIAKQFNVTQNVIWSVLNKKTWVHAEA